MFDLHVHADPDVLNRIGFDDQIAGHYVEAGFRGFVLKAHYESTVGRAAALARRFPLDVVGGIALNQHTRGINAAAVRAALSSGGRVVWFPTADSHTQESAGLPRLADQDGRLGREVYALPPVDPHSAVEARLVLDLIAEYDAVLCTGHVSRAECRWLFDEARARGIRRFVLTHPSYTVPGMSSAEIQEFARLGAFVEITAFQMLHQPGMTMRRLADVAQAAGPQLILSSDAGQPDSPAPPRALRDLCEALIGAGVDADLVFMAAGDTPWKLVFGPVQVPA